MTNSVSLLANVIGLGNAKIKFKAFKSDVVSKMNREIRLSCKSKAKYNKNNNE